MWPHLVVPLYLASLQSRSLMLCLVSSLYLVVLLYPVLSLYLVWSLYLVLLQCLASSLCPVCPAYPGEPRRCLVAAPGPRTSDPSPRRPSRTTAARRDIQWIN